MTQTTRGSAADPTAVAALAAELVDLIGPEAVATDLPRRERASVDGAPLSPILSELLPLGLADLVAFPRDAEQIAVVVSAATRHGVGITPRGKGTGNYGQAIPLHGGLVLDVSKAKAVVEIGDGWVTAEAGAQLAVIEREVRESGQQLWMYPSTAQSSLGGFLSGGSGGTGSIKYGVNHEGFVAALDVAHARPEPVLAHYEGDDAQPYVHTYGVLGVIARATVRLEPLQAWLGFYTSFPTFHQALSVLREIGYLDPTPRLVSADPAGIVAGLPADEAIPKGRTSLRAILDPATLVAATALVEDAGGRVEAVREGPTVAMKLSLISYNHPVEWLQRNVPGPWFHVEVGGHALVDRIDEVQAVYPEGMLHIEAQHRYPIGMLAGRYTSREAVYAGIEALRALGVGVHDCHQWMVDHEVERTRALALTADPAGLMNPGKLVR